MAVLEINESLVLGGGSGSFSVANNLQDPVAGNLDQVAAPWIDQQHGVALTTDSPRPSVMNQQLMCVRTWRCGSPIMPFGVTSVQPTATGWREGYKPQPRAPSPAASGARLRYPRQCGCASTGRSARKASAPPATPHYRGADRSRRRNPKEHYCPRTARLSTAFSSSLRISLARP